MPRFCLLLFGVMDPIFAFIVSICVFRCCFVSIDKVTIFSCMLFNILLNSLGCIMCNIKLVSLTISTVFVGSMQYPLVAEIGVKVIDAAVRGIVIVSISKIINCKFIWSFYIGGMNIL